MPHDLQPGDIIRPLHSFVTAVVRYLSRDGAIVYASDNKGVISFKRSEVEKVEEKESQ